MKYNKLYNQPDHQVFLIDKNQKITISDFSNYSELYLMLENIKHHGDMLKLEFDNGDKLVIHGVKNYSSINSWQALISQLNITLNQEYRTVDGSFNNLIHKDYGAANTNFIRISDSEYQDGLSIPAGVDRPSARAVSNEIFAQSSSSPNIKGASDIFWMWGQFLDHDITLVHGTAESMDILVPVGDPYFDPYYTGTQVINFHRSGYAEATGTDSPREHINQITAFIDASNIYGSDLDRADFLKDENGKLKVSENNLLPYNNGEYENAPNYSTHLFLAGDIRANENIALTSLHTIFVREHNRLVDELKLEHPEHTSEQLYQEAKIIVEAYMQAITFNEFLPLLLGEGAIPEYTGYNPNINPQISNEFAAAAFRLGHTLLSSHIERVNEDGSVFDSHLELKQAFFRPDLLAVDDNIEAILRGVAANYSENVDTLIVDDVRNFLFGPPGAGGFDLAALNIQRGRDHGLADYNQVREDYGLEKVTSFADITSDISLQTKLEDLYSSVDNIDLFVGALAEDPLLESGSMLGELLTTIIAEQFIRLRDGDRLWYEARLDQELIDEINDSKLSDIITRNTDIDFMQQDALLAYNRVGGDENNNILIGSDESDLILGFAGDDEIILSSGSDEIYGGSGSDRYFISVNSGIDTIFDFDVFSDINQDSDIIDLNSLNLTYADLQINQEGSNTVINLPGIEVGANQIVLVDIMPSELNSEYNFA